MPALSMLIAPLTSWSCSAPQCSHRHRSLPSGFERRPPQVEQACDVNLGVTSIDGSYDCTVCVSGSGSSPASFSNPSSIVQYWLPFSVLEMI